MAPIEAVTAQIAAVLDVGIGLIGRLGLRASSGHRALAGLRQ